MKVLESTVFCASAFLKWKNILILPFCSSQLQELQVSSSDYKSTSMLMLPDWNF